MPDSADYSDRLELIQRLMSLPTVQLDQVIFVLRPTAGNLPPNTAIPGERVTALLKWAESPIGPGLSALETALNEVVSVSTEAEKLSGSELAFHRAWKLANRQQQLLYGLITGLLVGLVFGLIFGLVAGLIVGLIFGLVAGLIVGLIIGLTVGLIFGLTFGLIAGRGSIVVASFD